MYFISGNACDIKYIDVSDNVAATINLDGISSQFKEILVLTCKGFRRCWVLSDIVDTSKWNILTFKNSALK